MHIGILQGRLSPKPSGEDRFQFFPEHWESEFHLARAFQLQCIEWLVDWKNWEENPILSRDVRTWAHIRDAKSITPISSLCADVCMEFPLYETPGKDALIRIMAASERYGIGLVLVPLLEKFGKPNPAEKKAIRDSVLMACAVNKGIRIGFETEMPAGELMEFIESIGRKNVGVYYDIGNCTSYGFNCPEDIRVLESRIFGIHVKDRHIGSSVSVPLGTGDADISGCIRALRDIEYAGPLIMQAWRGENFLEDARSQFSTLQAMLVEGGSNE